MAERVADRPRHDRRRPARRAGAARRRPDGARAGRAGARLAAADAAGRDGVTYAAKIDKAEARIDWSKPCAARSYNHCRGLSPFPGAWFELPSAASRSAEDSAQRQASGEGAPGTLLDDELMIACGDGAVRLVEVQRAGKRRWRRRISCAARARGRRASADALSRCPATSSPSNMTARPSAAGSPRPTACRCRRRWRRRRGLAASAVRRARRRPHRCRRARAGQVAHVDLPRPIGDEVSRRAEFPSAAAPDRGAGGRAGARRFRRPLLRHAAAYLYRILNRRAAALDGRVWHVARPLDAAAMHAAAQALIGQHDFTTFRAADARRSRRSRRSTARRRRDGDEMRSPPRRARSCTPGPLDGRIAGRSARVAGRPPT